MREIPRIEEPPPIHRSQPQPPVKRGVGRLIDWRRPSARRPEPSSPPASRGMAMSRTALALSLAAFTVIALQAYTLHRLARVRTDLSLAGANLEEARASLGMLWETTQRLDADQMTGLAQLTDSVRSVSAYAQGEMRLWDAAYYAHEQRLDENAGRIAGNAEAITRMTTAARATTARLDELARFGEAQQNRVGALEEQDRTQGSLVEALAGRTRTQEATLAGMTTTLATLRETLAEVDGELAELEDQLAASGSAYGELDTRIATLTGWVDGFRRAGLSGTTVESRLTALADELRRMRMRVDSLRPVRSAGRTLAEPR